ncbi:hypothetical protein DM01DRAFT_1349487 [Hesseltinella vesiculosa]|uniref:Uncharacterized protein n=1 Tax=Hesseltinella vesiculosa TaxID=101127 RepID=A0A1X2G5W1_9FUNG|nr:hypothetical protein DM01DRAFT_1349487 [Hesseltinella vesiculosa]
MDTGKKRYLDQTDTPSSQEVGKRPVWLCKCDPCMEYSNGKGEQVSMATFYRHRNNQRLRDAMMRGYGHNAQSASGEEMDEITEANVDTIDDDAIDNVSLLSERIPVCDDLAVSEAEEEIEDLYEAEAQSENDEEQDAEVEGVVQRMQDLGTSECLEEEYDQRDLVPDELDSDGEDETDLTQGASAAWQSSMVDDDLFDFGWEGPMDASCSDDDDNDNDNDNNNNNG